MITFDFDLYADASIAHDSSVKLRPLPPFNPDAVYDAMFTAIRAYDWPAGEQHAANLRAWLASGGREPARPHARAWITRICEIAAHR
jgi:hypothetical protein